MKTIQVEPLVSAAVNWCSMPEWVHAPTRLPIDKYAPLVTPDTYQEEMPYEVYSDAAHIGTVMRGSRWSIQSRGDRKYEYEYRFIRWLGRRVGKWMVRTGGHVWAARSNKTLSAVLASPSGTKTLVEYAKMGLSDTLDAPPHSLVFRCRGNAIIFARRPLPVVWAYDSVSNSFEALLHALEDSFNTYGHHQDSRICIDALKSLGCIP